ncbi:MAG: PH domain-containing protein [Deltaproteobacteria bacterium]|nr:PH domain-containing protein [Deltaproteobacteria bacterium]
MAFRFTDQHAMSLVAPHLYPGEQVLFRARGVEKPWYSRVFSRIGAFMWRYWLVVATNQRIVFVQHKGVLGGYAPKRTETFAWSDLEQVSLGWGIFNKTLVVKSKAKQLSRAVVIPRGWMKGNFDAAKGATTTWEQNRASLPPAPTLQALPAGV